MGVRKWIKKGPLWGRPDCRKHNEFKGFWSILASRKGPFWGPTFFAKAPQKSIVIFNDFQCFWKEMYHSLWRWKWLSSAKFIFTSEMGMSFVSGLSFSLRWWKWLSSAEFIFITEMEMNPIKWLSFSFWRWKWLSSADSHFHYGKSFSATQNVPYGYGYGTRTPYPPKEQIYANKCIYMHI